VARPKAGWQKYLPPLTGIKFEVASIEIQRTKDGAEYEGMMVRFHAPLAEASFGLPPE
jgi:hypothetical protein